eukprot:COSAG01_NODE_6618_length_3575_cov_6.344361_6_plen_211_part_00
MCPCRPRNQVVLSRRRRRARAGAQTPVAINSWALAAPAAWMWMVRAGSHTSPAAQQHRSPRTMGRASLCRLDSATVLRNSGQVHCCHPRPQQRNQWRPYIPAAAAAAAASVFHASPARRCLSSLSSAGPLSRLDFREIDTVLLDCDGVLWNGNTVIPGVPAMLSKLRDYGGGTQLLFITNNSTKCDTPSTFLSHIMTLLSIQAFGIFTLL